MTFVFRSTDILFVANDQKGLGGVVGFVTDGVGDIGAEILFRQDLQD